MTKVHPIYHKDGCGKIMLYTKLHEPPRVGNCMYAKDHVHINSNLVKTGEPVRCDSCGVLVPLPGIPIEWCDFNTTIEI